MLINKNAWKELNKKIKIGTKLAYKEQKVRNNCKGWRKNEDMEIVLHGTTGNWRGDKYKEKRKEKVGKPKEITEKIERKIRKIKQNNNSMKP